MSGILIWAETRNGDIRKSTLEAAGVALALSKSKSIPVSAVLLNDTALADRIGALGMDKVYTAEMDFSSEGYTESIASVAESMEADVIIMTATALGRDISARLAARLDCALAADVIDINGDGDGISIIRPMYAGKVLAEYELLKSPRIITLRPNVFSAVEPGEKTAPTEKISIEDLNIRAKVVQAIQAAEGVLDVTEADIIVSGGRGVRGPEGFKTVIEDLAKTLGAAVGASRAAVDAGWIPYKHQVGQTGKVVTPVLYIACGISGAIQHFAGMGSSKFIVAINTDSDAPIMKKADFAIVGDLFKVVPILKEELLKVLNK